MTFRPELEALINRHSLENGSDTPDFILAEYLSECLSAFDRCVAAREKWYGRGRQPIEGDAPSCIAEKSADFSAPPDTPNTAET